MAFPSISVRAVVEGTLDNHAERASVSCLEFNLWWMTTSLTGEIYCLQLKRLFKEREGTEAAAQTGTSSLQDWTPPSKITSVRSQKTKNTNRDHSSRNKQKNIFFHSYPECTAQEGLAAGLRYDACVWRAWGEQWLSGRGGGTASRGGP